MHVGIHMGSELMTLNLDEHSKHGVLGFDDWTLKYLLFSQCLFGPKVRLAENKLRALTMYHSY